MRKSDQRNCSCQSCQPKCEKVISRRRSSGMCGFCEMGIHREKSVLQELHERFAQSPRPGTFAALREQSNVR